MLSGGAGNGVFRQYRSHVGMAGEVHLLLDRRSEVLNQMKAISHLAGLRRSLSGSLGVETATISTDDLNGRAFLQPRFRTRNAAVVQNINDRSALEIDYDRAVSCGAAPAPIVDANDPDIIRDRIRSPSFDLAKDRVIADRHTEPAHQMFRGAATHAVADQVYDRRHPNGAPRVGPSDIRQPVGECSPLTFPAPALPPSQGEMNFHHLTLSWQVLKRAIAPTVPMTTSRIAIWANSHWFR